MSRTTDRCEAFRAWMDEQGFNGKSLARRDFLDLFMLACDVSLPTASQNFSHGETIGLWRLETPDTIRGRNIARTARVLLPLRSGDDFRGSGEDAAGEKIAIRAADPSPLSAV